MVFQGPEQYYHPSDLPDLGQLDDLELPAFGNRCVVWFAVSMIINGFQTPSQAFGFWSDYDSSNMYTLVQQLRPAFHESDLYWRIYKYTGYEPHESDVAIYGDFLGEQIFYEQPPAQLPPKGMGRVVIVERRYTFDSIGSDGTIGGLRETDAQILDPLGDDHDDF